MIPADKLQPEMTFAAFVELVRSGQGKAIRTKTSRGPLRVLGKLFLWAVVAVVVALPVIVPLDVYRRFRNAQGHLTFFVIFELFILAVWLYVAIDSRRDAPRKKRRQQWNVLCLQ